MSLAAPDKAGNVFELALQVLGALQEAGDARTLVTAFGASRAEKLAYIDAVESHEREFLHDNGRLEHQPVMARVEKERLETWDVESTKAITNAKVELANEKGASHVVDGQASADMLAMRSAMEGRDCLQGELTTTSEKLQVVKEYLNATFDHLN